MFFNLYNDEVTMDPDGEEFASVADARRSAIVSAREMVAASITRGDSICLKHRIEAVDDHDKIVFTVHFGDVIDLRT